jgi:hypothetical protein
MKNHGSELAFLPDWTGNLAQRPMFHTAAWQP